MKTVLNWFLFLATLGFCLVGWAVVFDLIPPVTDPKIIWSTVLFIGAAAFSASVDGDNK